MKLSREFSFQEKMYLTILGIGVIVLLYVKLVDMPVRNGIRSANSDAEYYEMEMIALDIKVAELEKMEREVSDIEEGGISDNGHVWSRMPSYNASFYELDFLHETLATASDYVVSFRGVTRSRYQIRREFTLQYQVDSFADAVDIMSRIENSDIRCLIRDFSISPTEGDDIAYGAVRVSCVATFYETMWDGVEDNDLPRDSAAAAAVMTDVDADLGVY